MADSVITNAESWALMFYTASSLMGKGAQMHYLAATVPYGKSRAFATASVTLRVQVLNNHMLTQNQFYNYFYPKPKYLIIGYMDPLGKVNPTP